MASTRFNTEHSQDADGMLATSLEDIPRYLFRVTHPQSQGTTNLAHVSSAAYDLGYFHMTDLYQIQPLETAADILYDHLRERYIAPPNADRPTRNLVSWTSSLLFALQCALYNHHRNRWRNTYDLGNIFILMVDTHRFQKGTFARDIQAIDFFRRFSNASNKKDFELLSRWRNGDDYYNGEYLSQGKLTIGPSAACRVSMKELTSRGLEHICPELMDKQNWDSWAKRVRALRLDMSPVEYPEIPRVKTVAQAFDHFQVPIVIMLFSMSLHSSPEALEKYTRFIIEQYPHEKVAGVTLRDFPATDRLPEIERCNEMTARLIARLNTGEITPSAEASSHLMRTSEGPIEEPSLLAGTPDSSADGVDSLTGGLAKLGISPVLGEKKVALSS